MRMTVIDNFPFIEYFQRLIHSLAKDPENQSFNDVCNQLDHQTKHPCQLNIARAMVDTHVLLTNEISPYPGDWMWKRVHTSDYPHIPFSMSPLKFLFHREVPTAGNENTVKVSEYQMKDFYKTHRFKSMISPNYKQVVQFADNEADSKMFYSVDTGQSGNLFAGHYFDFN